jgi:hypothetical protein
VWNREERAVDAQADFAEFIEDRLTDIVVPNLDDPTIKTFARLVQGKFAEPRICSHSRAASQVNVETNVKNALNLSTGEIACATTSSTATARARRSTSRTSSRSSSPSSTGARSTGWPCGCGTGSPAASSAGAISSSGPSSSSTTPSAASSRR